MKVVRIDKDTAIMPALICRVQIVRDYVAGVTGSNDYASSWMVQAQFVMGQWFTVADFMEHHWATSGMSHLDDPNAEFKARAVYDKILEAIEQEQP